MPAPIEGYVSTRVLTMEYVHGTKVTALNPVALIDVDPEGLADELIQAYLHQILIDGFFHADPHPGNVFITEDGRLALIDLGMVGHLSPTLQDKLLKLVLAISEGRGEEAADAAIALGEKREGFDDVAFTRDVVAIVGHYFGASLQELQVGKIVLEVNRSAGAHGIKSPVELTMLGKTLLNLDNIARTLAPALDVNAAIRTNASSLMQRRLLKSLSPGTVFTTVLEAKEFAEQLPRRINRVLESLASSQLKLKVEVIDEGAVIDGLQKVANRITMGLVLAALIVSAAMMMQIESRFTLLGYPGFPTLLLAGRRRPRAVARSTASSRTTEFQKDNSSRRNVSLLGLCQKDDAILFRLDFLEDGRIEAFQIVQRRERSSLAAILQHGRAFTAKQLQHAFEIDRFGGVHVECLHDVAFEVRRQIVENRREIPRRALRAECLHPIDGFDPSFARQFDRRGFRGFVTGSAEADRLFFARPVRQRVLRECRSAQSAMMTKHNRSRTVRHDLVDRQRNAERPDGIIVRHHVHLAGACRQTGACRRCDRRSAVPQFFAGRRIERVKHSVGPAVAAAKREDHAVDDNRRARRRIVRDVHARSSGGVPALSRPA